MVAPVLLLAVGVASDRIATLERRVSDLERVAPREFRVVHYNVLAEQYGSNTVPWFLYGADVTPEERKTLLEKFYIKKGDKYTGWPAWAEGVLSPARVAAVEEYDAAAFEWCKRSERLWRVVEAAAGDVLTLAECDRFDEFWSGRLHAAGYAATWRKRPRASSRDGCAIAWRESTFELEASAGFDYGGSSSASAAEADRTCCFALLRWRRDPSTKVLVATTHLARNPEQDKQLWPRSFQFGCLLRELRTFADAHDALRVPVVLSGDLNSKDCDVLSGLARSMSLLVSAPTHPLLWSLLDAPTPPTTYTDDRCCRIDYLLYQSSLLQLRAVDQLPLLTYPIPDPTQHPSDHLPIAAHFALAHPFDATLSAVREWFACVSGASVARPLCAGDLREAFRYFDKDGSGAVSLLELEVGLQTLGASVGAIVEGIPRVRSALAQAAAACDTPVAPTDCWRTEAAAGEARLLIGLDAFVSAYARAAAAISASAMSRQLDMAFAAFDLDHDGSVTPEELRAGLAAAATAPLDEERVAELIAELDADGDGSVSREEYSAGLMRRYRRTLAPVA